MLAVMLAPLLGVKETVPVVATALIISNIARIWAFRKSVAIKEYLAVFLTGLPFIVLSAYVYVSLPVGVVAGEIDGKTMAQTFVDWRKIEFVRVVDLGEGEDPAKAGFSKRDG